MEMNLRCIAVIFATTVMSFGATRGNGQSFTGNLLMNPGGETGMVDPWDPHPDTTLSNSSGDLSTGSISATEGAYWFRREGEIAGLADVPGLIDVGFLSVIQTIDVRSFGQIKAVTAGGDFFGVGELLTGSGHPVIDPVSVLVFLDENMDSIDTKFLIDVRNVNVDSPATVIDLRATISDVPAETAFLRYVVRNGFGVSGQSGSNPGTVRGIVGVDELFLSISYVPEPSTFALATLAFAALTARSRQTIRRCA